MSTQDCKMKHLEFIQQVITRMNSNSFLIKGWSVTLVSALFALAASGTNHKFVLISYIVVPLFWILDSFYLSQEKQYRHLYDEVRTKAVPDINFSMNASSYNKDSSTWTAVMTSKTIVVFYGVLILTVSIVMYFL